MPLLFLIFVAVPLIELIVIIKVGGIIGALPTVGLLVLSAIIGISLLKREGLNTLKKARQRQLAGQSPELEALESVIVALSGLLMILPGFITDIIGLCGLFPPVRHLLIERMKKRVHIRTSGFTYEGERANGEKNPSESQKPHVIEGTFERKNDNHKKK